MTIMKQGSKLSVFFLELIRVRFALQHVLEKNLFKLCKLPAIAFITLEVFTNIFLVLTCKRKLEKTIQKTSQARLQLTFFYN